MQYGGIKRPLLVTAGEHPALWPSQPPIAAENPQQLRREHDVTVLAALALLDPDHHPLTVDVGNLQQNHLGHAQSGGIDRRQRGAALEAWNCLQEAHDLVSAQHHRQLARLARIADAIRNGVVAERHTVEKPQRTDDLIECRPGYPDRHQVDLEGTDILQFETIGGPTEIPAQLRYRGKVGWLRLRRQIADRHVLDHAAAKRADLSHWK